jgi:tetratricopeptide (TPR) repeat protein
MAIKKYEEGDLKQLGNIISGINKSESKELEEAIAFYEKILNESEWDADNYLRLADIMYTNNDRVKSLKYYKIAYQKNPDDEWTIYRMGRGIGTPGSKDMFSRLQKGDTTVSRLSKTRLMEMDLLNKVEEVY